MKDWGGSFTVEMDLSLFLVTGAVYNNTPSAKALRRAMEGLSRGFLPVRVPYIKGRPAMGVITSGGP